MKKRGRLRAFAYLAAWAAAATLLGGCEVILGINEPLDRVVDGGERTSDATPINTRDATSTVPSTDAAVTDANGGATHAWAEWPMPNPPSTGLPNPQSYDTTKIPGVVVDKVTGLAWQQAVDENTYTWTGALSYCAELDLAGGGWRLPARIELLSILDFTHTNVLIDMTAFPGTPSAHFWTSSPLAGDSSAAWSIDFGFGTGFAYDEPMSTKERVRCVR